MTAKLPTLTRTYPLPLGFEVEFSIGTDDTGTPHFVAAWAPRRPNRREFRKLLEAYRAARHRFAADVSAELGGSVAIVEV